MLEARAWQAIMGRVAALGRGVRGAVFVFAPSYSCAFWCLRLHCPFHHGLVRCAAQKCRVVRGGAGRGGCAGVRPCNVCALPAPDACVFCLSAGAYVGVCADVTVWQGVAGHMRGLGSAWHVQRLSQVCSCCPMAVYPSTCPGPEHCSSAPGGDCRRRAPSRTRYPVSEIQRVCEP